MRAYAKIERNDMVSGFFAFLERGFLGERNYRDKSVKTAFVDEIRKVKTR